jgi:hypothetical protein
MLLISPLGDLNMCQGKNTGEAQNLHEKFCHSISKSIRSLSTSPCRVLTLSAARSRDRIGDRIDLEMESGHAWHSLQNRARHWCHVQSDSGPHAQP